MTTASADRGVHPIASSSRIDLLSISFCLALAFTVPESAAHADVPNGVWVRDGYELTVAEDSIQTPRFLHTGPNGVLFVSVPKAGQIKACRDTTGDGKFDQVVNYLEGHDPKKIMQALEWHDGWLWFADVSSIYKSRDTDGDDKVDEVIPVIGPDQLPVTGGGHRWRALLIHGDRIYTHIGDQTNATDEPIDAGDRKKIWTFALDGTDKQLFASGIRNTEKFDVRPGTDEIWGVDHDIDMFAWPLEGTDLPHGQPITDHNPPAELNHYAKDGFYGHPYILGKNMPNLNFLDKPDLIKLAAMNTIPEWTMAAHCSGNGMTFYRGNKFPGATGDIFVAMRGGWNATRKVGYCVSRILFENGHPYGELKMVDLLKDGTEVLGRPADCTEAQDGSLLFSDDTGNRIYRLRYVGKK